MIKCKCYISIYLLASILLLLNCRTSKEIKSQSAEFKALERTSYFKYCTKKEKRKLKEIGLEHSLKHNYIFEQYDDTTFQPFTKRNYIIDGEYLSDFGGIEEFINTTIKPFYEASGFKLDLTEHIIEFDTIEFTRYEKIIVNQREYEIFKNDNVRYGEGWYIAPIRIAEMLNTELFIQKFEEKFYLINSGNDLAGSFLTKSQYDFFKKHINDPYQQPQTTENWKNLYNIK